MQASGASSIQTIKLTQVANFVEANAKNGKYTMLFDKNGNCEVFFRYKATLDEVHKLSLGLQMGKSKDEAIEELRRKLVYCMKSGDNLVLFVDKIAPDFKSTLYHKEDFPTDVIFNFQEFRKTEVYKKVLRGEED